MVSSSCGISPVDKKYMSVIQLLDEIGPWNERLKRTYHIVKNPNFTYHKTPTSSFLSVTLANSSYWLDKELFDTKVVKKDLNDKTLTAVQKSHLYLLEIGSILMDKGFPLNQENIDRFVSKDSPLYTWSKNFLIQCRKRSTWLKQKQPLVHKKQLPLPSNSKTR